MFLGELIGYLLFVLLLLCFLPLSGVKFKGCVLQKTSEGILE